MIVVSRLRRNLIRGSFGFGAISGRWRVRRRLAGGRKGSISGSISPIRGISLVLCFGVRVVDRVIGQYLECPST